MSKVILVGKSAAGKDHLRKILQSRGFKYAVSYTTRPKREKEIDGLDYFFIEKKDFNNKLLSGEWYEYVEFNNWYYGTTREQFKNCNLFIMTPAGLSKVDPIDRKQCTVIYLDVSKEVRMQRLLDRGDNNDSLERRMSADEKDFETFTDFDIRITESNF